jgi:hypothetical protein
MAQLVSRLRGALTTRRGLAGRIRDAVALRGAVVRIHHAEPPDHPKARLPHLSSRAFGMQDGRENPCASGAARSPSSTLTPASCSGSARTPMTVTTRRLQVDDDRRIQGLPELRAPDAAPRHRVLRRGPQASLLRRWLQLRIRRGLNHLSPSVTTLGVWMKGRHRRPQHWLVRLKVAIARWLSG